MKRILLELLNDDDLPFSGYKVLHLRNLNAFWLLLETQGDQIYYLFRWRNNAAALLSGDDLIFAVTLNQEEEILFDSLGLKCD